MGNKSVFDFLKSRNNAINEGLTAGIEAQEKILKLKIVSGYDIDYLIELFARGFTMQKDDITAKSHTTSYLQKPIDFDYWLSEEKLDRLLEHCKKEQKYGGRTAEEHIIVECLIKKYWELEDNVPKQVIREKLEEEKSIRVISTR